ncbi:BREX-2 system phosphatase PglZ [Actinoalloteichus caeruleus]|uniref:BREX-2 system phosphatase PglZ n=2 Tax=Actinoalloteichus cyanogriseus TaxID=2893586 RepID=UPI0004BEE3C8|nr:BREX-2 system phosphatase PglZ [Actinoalloteichus caeruleus]
MSAPPTVDRRIVEAMVEDWLPHANGRRLLLVYGRYSDGGTSFTLVRGSERVRVRVTDQHSVLGIVEVWQDHQRRRVENELLVVATSVPDDQLGWELRAHAIGRSTRTVDRARIVAQRFGAVSVDTRIRRDTWLVDALLDAEPPEGWPRGGSVLTRDTAIRSLIGARLGPRILGDGALDAGALLDWTRDPAGPVRFASLSEAERAGLVDWLVEAVGEAAVVLMRLVAEGRGSDVMPLGVVGAAATDPGATVDTAFAFGSLIGGTRTEEVRAFTAAVAGTLQRWVSEAASSRTGDAARHRVMEVVRRADRIADAANLTESLAENDLLPSTFTRRLRALAGALAHPARARSEHLNHALSAVRDHALARLEPARVRPAEMAARLARWLAEPTPEVTSVAAGISGQMNTWSWVDRAVTALAQGDPSDDPVVGQAYRAVCEAARKRRDALDEEFATHVARWTQHASAQESAGCLLIEQVLADVVAPLKGKPAPLLIVLDGMSGAVAVDLAEQLAGNLWHEVTPDAGRRTAAVAALPSVTRVSRASLLTGQLGVGGQADEEKGFRAFWQHQHRKTAFLFHKADIPGEDGYRLSDSLLGAISDSAAVVGVVLNTVDYALDQGREGDRTQWSLRDVTYLPELLDAARSYGRPVVLTSDHGHVLARPGSERTSAPGAESARWRTGEPKAGEIAVTGPRVMYGQDDLVVPWREDIRYTSAKNGYHGGVSLAEMTVPVLAFLPPGGAEPAGWTVLSPEVVQPDWWTGRTLTTELGTGKRGGSRKSRATEDVVPLFPVEPATVSLGTQVVATEIYQGQCHFVPRAPDGKVVADVIDAVVSADGILSTAAVTTVAGRAARRPEFFVTTLQRLLNVDGYPVLSVVDGGQRLKLDVEVLRTQFGVRGP